MPGELSFELSGEPAELADEVVELISTVVKIDASCTITAGKAINKKQRFVLRGKLNSLKLVQKAWGKNNLEKKKRKQAEKGG